MIEKKAWIAAGAVIVVAGISAGIWYVEGRAKAPAPQASSASSGPLPGPTSSTPSALGLVYENDRFQGDPFNDAEFALADLTTGTSTVVKPFDGLFTAASAAALAPWTAMDGSPFVLSLRNDSSASSTQIEFLNPSDGTIRDVSIDRSPIISPYGSVGVSEVSDQVAYCDPNGQFTILDAARNASATFQNARACYAEEIAQPPQFADGGAAVYYSTIPSNENGYIAGTSTVIWKLNTATGAVSQVSDLVVGGLRHRGNASGTEYVDAQYGGFTIRKFNTNIEDPQYGSINGLDSLPIVADVTLPTSSNIGDAMFTADGNGVFYYTFEIAGQSASSLELGYYDIAADKNYYPLVTPSETPWGISLLAAADRDHLAYEVITVPFSGGTQAGHVYERNGSSSLYVVGVDTPPTLIDTGIAGFPFAEFLVSK